MDASLLEKQEYLSKEILEAGHDPEEFQEFMINNSNKELNLEYWTFQELKAIVAQFKNRGADERLFEEPQKPAAELHPQPVLNFDHVESPSTLKSYTVNSSLYKFYQLQQKTNLPELYILAHLEHKHIKVNISKYSKTVPNNIFQSSYICYVIDCSEGWTVSRRFNDFVWLRKYLMGIYPGLPVPPIPEKTTLRSYDEKHIEYRMEVLTKFLNFLIKMPEVCSDHILENFIRAETELFSQIKRKKDQSLSEDKKSNKLATVWGEELLLEGLAGVEPSKCLEYQEIHNKCGKLCLQLNTLQQSLKKVIIDTQAVSETYKELEKVMISPKNTAFCSIMSNFFDQFEFQTLRTVNQIKTNIQSVWHYQQLYLSNLNEAINRSIKQQSSLSQKYKTVMMRIAERDEGQHAYINSLEPNREIKEYQIAKEKYKIRLSYLMREVSRYEESNFRELAREWCSTLRVYIGEISEWMIGCTDHLTQAMSLGEGKQLVQVEYLRK